MLETLFVPELKRLVGNDLSRQWVQQDGATAHTLTFIRSELANHIISLHTDNVWPPHCPISILLTFIYRATDLALLKDNISTRVRRIPKEILQKVIQNFNRRLEKLIIAKGRHMYFSSIQRSVPMIRGQETNVKKKTYI
jgi:hypothetical protein